MCRNKKLTQEKKEEPSDRSVNDPKVLLEKYIVFTSCRKKYLLYEYSTID